MRKTFLGLSLAGALLTPLSIVTESAAADSYKWCAEYAGGMGSSNCGFTSREQCQADVGAGGFCRENLFYTGAAEKPVKPEKKHNPG
jgi:Protein of unknown function (DUF3551)